MYVSYRSNGIIPSSDGTTESSISVCAFKMWAIAGKSISVYTACFFRQSGKAETTAETAAVTEGKTAISSGWAPINFANSHLARSVRPMASSQFPPC